MKFQYLERDFLNKKSSVSSFSSSSNSYSSSSFSLGFKRFCPPATASTHLQHQHEFLSGGGTRWKPTQEQVRKLESLYKSGMRTPNSQQIEKIASDLIKYGRIEGKNVFYWFQNHKARERQKHKRNSVLCPSYSMNYYKKGAEEKNYKDARSKRSRSSGLDLDKIKECGAEDRVTLELFPLHPEKINENI